MDARALRAEHPVFFRVRFAVTGRFGLGGHLVGGRLIDASVELDVQPHPAVDLGVAFVGVQRPQMRLRNQIEDSVNFTPLLKIDVGVEPFGESVVPKDADSDRDRAGAAPRHAHGMHVAAVGEV